MLAALFAVSGTVFGLSAGATSARSHPPRQKVRVSVIIAGVAHRPLRAGDSVVVRWLVSNSTQHALRRLLLRFYLSPSRAMAPRGSFGLLGRSMVPALGSGQTARGKIRLRVPRGGGWRKGRHPRAVAARVPGGALYLTACTAGSCGSSAAPLPVSCGAVSSAACPTLSGRVLYESRGCYFGPTSEAPLPDAKLVLTSADGSTQEVRLGRDGTYNGVQVSGALPVKAAVILDDSQIAVSPDAPGAGPYEVQLGDAARLDPSTGRVVSIGTLVARGDGPAGAASIFAILDKGAHVAAAASPVVLPKLTARWRFGKRLDRASWLGDRPPPSAYDPNGSNQIYISGALTGAQPHRDEFEANVLLHEYAHHVMKYVADPGPTGGEMHTLTSVYPNDPALPWSEGFSDAFSAIASDDPRLTQGCKAILDLSTSPASASDQTTSGMQPQPSAAKFLPVSSGIWLAGDPRSQYNETVDAGVVWQAVIALGGSNVFLIPGVVPEAVLQTGLTRFLGALDAYHKRFGGPSDMRQVRDALIGGGAEQSQADHDLISAAFADEGVVGFGAGVQARFSGSSDAVCVADWDPSNPGAGGCEESSVISISGPGYSCTLSTPPGQGGFMHKYTDGTLVGQGDIPYAWQDDCYASTEEIWLRLPFLAGGGHLGGPYTATLQLSCKSHVVYDPNNPGQVANGQCPSTYHLEVKVDTTQAVGDGESLIANGFGVYSATADVGANSSTTLATFKADGSSCTFVGGGNCGPQ
jgi:hypothetical protein